uniref:Methylosome subunit pICln n=1 Tax=Amphimedon queenslandica TaxID=400682 RepID=A0A1X7VQZ5_AMPQE
MSFAGTDSVLQVPNTTVYVQGQDKGPGLLSIEESCVQWTSDSQTDIITLEYPLISLHAVSRDVNVFPYPCLYLLYCQEEEEEEDDDDIEDEGSPVEKITEFRFIPLSPDSLDSMYSALCECQALYPDSELSSDSQADEEEELGEGVELIEDEGSARGLFYTSAEEGFPHLSSQGMATLQHLEQVIQMPRPEEFESMVQEGYSNGGQYEDANEEEGGGEEAQ